MTPQELLNISPRDGEKLHAALFTTFEPADRAILADRLLPALLGLPPAPPTEAQEFARSRAQLCAALNHLRGKIIVVSSAGDDARMAWLSSYIRFRSTAEVQHAKLWLLHWKKPSGVERLELVVSSANLTAGGIDGQIQGAWRASVNVDKKANDGDSWGDLPHFLAKLNDSIGASDDLGQFSSLLKRATCPAGVQFVATAPGDAKRWGASSLKRALAALGILPRKVRILSPYIGAWNHSSVQEWLTDSGSADATTLELAAVKTDAIIPESSQWKLPPATRDALWRLQSERNRLTVRFGLLTDATTKALRGGIDATFDPRWTHAKLYEFKGARKTALLVTSANFTPTAWANDGSGNFELGVLLQGQVMPFECSPPKQRDDILANGQAMMDSSGLWGNAEWDGERITVLVKNLPGIDVTVASQGVRRERVEGKLRKITIAHCSQPPATATLGKDKRSIQVPILDMRADSDELPIGDVAPDTWQDWRDQLLLESYGYTPAPDGDERRGKENGDEKTDGDYSVPVLMEARRYFNYIDGWQEKFDSGQFQHHVKADGRKLIALFRRHGTKSDAMTGVFNAVAEEFTVRLKLARVKHE
jgi:hypothetical protein